MLIIEFDFLYPQVFSHAMKTLTPDQVGMIKQFMIENRIKRIDRKIIPCPYENILIFTMEGKYNGYKGE